MDKQTAAEITKHLRVLFSAFPPAQRSDEATVAQTYLAVLDGHSLEAIQRSVEQFVRGMVPTHDGRFVPSAAEIARNVRQWDDAIKVRDEAQNPRKLASGLLKIDFGYGPIDMTKLTLEQQDEVLRTGRAPVTKIAGVKPKLQRMGGPRIISGDPEGNADAA